MCERRGCAATLLHFPSSALSWSFSSFSPSRQYRHTLQLADPSAHSIATTPHAAPCTWEPSYRAIRAATRPSRPNADVVTRIASPADLLVVAVLEEVVPLPVAEPVLSVGAPVLVPLPVPLPVGEVVAAAPEPPAALVWAGVPVEV